MGFLDGKRTISFSIPKDQYDSLMVMFDEVQKVNPKFDPDVWFSKLIGAWLNKNWKEFVRKTFQNGKRKKSR